MSRIDTEGLEPAPHRAELSREPRDAAAPSGPRLRAWHLALSAGLGGGLLWLAARELPLVPDELGLPGWVWLAYGLCLVAYLAARAGRWILLVAPLGTVRPSDAWWAALAGFAWTALLPLRLGELSRPLALARRGGGFFPILGTVALERVVDAGITCALAIACLAGRESLRGRPELWSGALSLALACGLAAGVLLGLALAPRPLARALTRPIARLSPRLAAATTRAVDELALGLAALPSPIRLLTFVGASAGYWLINALGIWILALGCGLELGLVDAAALMAVLALTLLIPGGPAQLGSYQLGVAWGLALTIGAAGAGPAASRFAFWSYVLQLGAIAIAGLGAQLVLLRARAQ